jgi:CheY-like chemotaxis protein
MKQDRDNAYQAGCDGFIAKPIDTRALPELIYKFLQTKATDETIKEK